MPAPSPGARNIPGLVALQASALAEKAPALARGARFKRICSHPPTPAHRPVQSVALSRSRMCAAPQRLPALKITPDPWLASETPHDFISDTSLTISSPLSPLFLHSTDIPTSGSSPCCSLCLEHTFPRQPQAGLPHFIQVSAQVSATQRGLS